MRSGGNNDVSDACIGQRRSGQLQSGLTCLSSAAAAFDYAFASSRDFPDANHALIHAGWRPRPLHCCSGLSGLRYVALALACFVEVGGFKARSCSTDRPAFRAICRICSRALLTLRKCWVFKASITSTSRARSWAIEYLDRSCMFA